jgi:hypothetical protein
MLRYVQTPSDAAADTDPDKAHKSIVFNKPSIYSSHEWMTIPFIGMPRDAHQRLADIELTVPLCMQSLQIGGGLRAFFSTPISPGTDVEPCRKLTRKLMTDLDNWAASYPNLTYISKDLDDMFHVKPSAQGLDIANEDSSSPPLPDTFIALIASNYISTKLTLNMLMHKTDTQASPPPDTTAEATAQYFNEATQCAKAILRGAAHVEKAQTPGFDLLRSIAPLVTVMCIGPGEEQFRDAMAMMARWGARIGGLSSIMKTHILAPKGR